MKKAKVDAIIKRKVAEARAEAERERDRAVQRLNQVREEYELLMRPPDEQGVTVLGEVPKHRFFRVAIHPMFAPRVFDPERVDPYMMRDPSYRMATFETLQKRQSFGNGQSVVWFEYQFRGLG